MYKKPFKITSEVGNNAFSFDQRLLPQLTVASLIDGSISDIQVGDHIAFEDFDEHGVLQSCKGLKHFVKTDIRGIPVTIFDNHNHAFYFWHEALFGGVIEKGATLVHIDGHRDTRVPERNLTAEESGDLEAIFNYTNHVLNVGNYIPPAIESGLVGEVISVISEQEMNESTVRSIDNLIVNIDLDFWAEELNYIDWNQKIKYTKKWMHEADVITISTSPFFIDSERAMKALRELFTERS